MTPTITGERELREFLTEQRVALWRTVSAWLPRYGRSVDVDDVVQQTYVKAFRSVCTVRTNHASALRAWLFRIARNLVVDDNRRWGRDATTAVEDPDSVVFPDGTRPAHVAEGQPAETRERRDSTLNDLLVLRRDEQMALILRDFQTVSWSTSTELLGRPSEKAARNLHLRGRARLPQRRVGISFA